MKLILCFDCGDVFQLRKGVERTCACGRCRGKYVDSVNAEVSGDSISLALGNGSVEAAVRRMAALRQRTNDTADRKAYQEEARIEFAWVRPNSGPGNPHCKEIA